MDEMIEEVSFSASDYTGFGLVCQWERRIPSTSDTKSIALAQIHWMSLAEFLRYHLSDSLGCRIQGTNPSSFAFFR